MKVITCLTPAVAALAVFVAGCKENAKTGDSSSVAPAASDAGAKTVDLPDDPMFADFAYPGATATDALNMGGATSVWYQSTDDFQKIADFYTGKFSAGTAHVEAERGYFGLPDAAGGPFGATLTRQPDGSSQIILKREHR